MANTLPDRVHRDGGRAALYCSVKCSSRCPVLLIISQLVKTELPRQLPRWHEILFGKAI